MYAIAERKGQVGQERSYDNSRLWLRADGSTTPASNEADEWNTVFEAEAVAAENGLEISANSWWCIVDMGNEE